MYFCKKIQACKSANNHSVHSQVKVTRGIPGKMTYSIRETTEFKCIQAKVIQPQTLCKGLQLRRKNFFQFVVSQTFSKGAHLILERIAFLGRWQARNKSEPCNCSGFYFPCSCGIWDLLLLHWKCHIPDLKEKSKTSGKLDPQPLGNWASDIWIHQDLNPLEVALKARADWETKDPKNSASPNT